MWVTRDAYLARGAGEVRTSHFVPSWEQVCAYDSKTRDWQPGAFAAL